ncbi:hypothetical protein D3C72_1106090 [compost metagenome]
MGEFPDLLCHNGETLARFPGPGSFDTRIQGQKIGLESNVVNDADDVGDFTRGPRNRVHGGNCLLDDVAGMFGMFSRSQHQFAGLAGALAGIGHGGGDFLQCGCGFFQRGRLLFGALRELIGGDADFA